MVNAQIARLTSIEKGLIRQFKDMCLEEAIPGRVVSNKYGECYLIADECISEFGEVDYDNLAGFCKNESLAIIDIETLGFSHRPIILLGIANIRKNMTCIHQFLLRDTSEELGAIWSFLSHVETGSSLITYNGKRFDIPYIEQRLAHYGKEASFNNPHYDILNFTWRALGKKLPNCRLETVERYFGIQRGMNIPGWCVPYFYNTYLKTRNVGPLVPIVKHNKQDLINLGRVVSRLFGLSARASAGYSQEYSLRFLRKYLESGVNIGSKSVHVTVEGKPHWWERRANKPYKCSACDKMIIRGEKYIGRKKFVYARGKRGPYGHEGLYVTDFYHIVCLMRSARDGVAREIEDAKAETNRLEHEIDASKLKITDEKKRIGVCADEKHDARHNYETACWWRKVDRWFGLQITSLAKDMEISRLNKEIVAIENRQIPERRVEIDNLQRQMETSTVRSKEIESKIQELINANVVKG